jgi:putative radical SAM enzyme (TIGR03279 family)
MRRFASAGISMNCQIVCCPGINDGERLFRSMEELTQLYPAVSSVSVVPVGLTKHRSGLYPLESCGKEKSAEIIDTTDTFGAACLEKYGTRIFFCADELYLKADREIPSEEYYEDYPQIENGVGMLRSMQEEFILALADIKKAPAEPFSIATGVAAARYLTKILELAEEKCGKIYGDVYPIRNDFFGESVDVAGLVTGGDIIAQLRGKPLGKKLLIPASMLRHGGDIFLDDVPIGKVEEELGVPLVLVPNDGYMFASAIFENGKR